MLLCALLVTSAALLAATFYTVKRMRTIDIMTNVISLLTSSGLLTLMHKSGLSRRMRPKCAEVTGPNGFKCVLVAPFFSALMPEVLKFKTRNDDIFIVTYPKAGTTWLQEIIWLLCNEADFKGAKQKTLTARIPFIETVDSTEHFKGIQTLENWPKNKQRLIKTHMPFELLPDEVQRGKKCNIVYLARNPKDLCVSYYFFHKMNLGMPEAGAWSEFLTTFCSDKVAWGSYFSHVLTYWKKFQDGDQRIYFTTYESLKKDLKAELVHLAKFLGKDLSDEQLDGIVDHCSFDSMSKNDSSNYSKATKYGLDFTVSKFMRKGQVGDWKNYFTINQNEAFNALYDSKMKDSGLQMEFE